MNFHKVNTVTQIQIQISAKQGPSLCSLSVTNTHNAKVNFLLTFVTLDQICLSEIDINGALQYVLPCFFHSTLCLRFILLHAEAICPFSLLNNNPLHKYTTLFIYSPVDGYWFALQFQAITTKSARSILVSFWCAFLVCIQLYKQEQNCQILEYAYVQLSRK